MWTWPHTYITSSGVFGYTSSVSINLFVHSQSSSQCLSALHLFILASWSKSLILLDHGEHLRTCTSLELTGECLLSSARNVSTVGFTTEPNLRLISDVSWCLSIHLMFWKDELMEGGSGIFISRLQSSAKWSDVSSFKTELDNRILLSGWLIYDPI